MRSIRGGKRSGLHTRGREEPRGTRPSYLLLGGLLALLVVSACATDAPVGGVGSLSSADVLAAADSAWREVLEYFDRENDVSLTPDIYLRLIAQGKVGAYLTQAPFFDIGTPYGYEQFCDYAAAGRAMPLSP